MSEPQQSATTPGGAFGDRFRVLLAEWGDSDFAVADFLGLDYKTIYLVRNENLQLPELAVVRLAKRWGVTPGYLAGQPGAEREPRMVSDGKARLRRHLLARESHLGFETVLAYRVRLVLQFLMKAVPRYYTHEFVARWVHLTPGTLSKVLALEAEIGAYTICRTALLSGIPERWFWQLDADLRLAETSPVLVRHPLDFAKAMGVMLFDEGDGGGDGIP